MLMATKKMQFSLHRVVAGRSMLVGEILGSRASMYYAFTSLSTVGFGDFGDMHPENNFERGFCAFILLALLAWRPIHQAEIMARPVTQFSDTY